jgi:hypothetical protein
MFKKLKSRSDFLQNTVRVQFLEKQNIQIGWFRKQRSNIYFIHDKVISFQLHYLQLVSTISPSISFQAYGEMVSENFFH